jgi:cytochrome c peroxidase
LDVNHRFTFRHIPFSQIYFLLCVLALCGCRVTPPARSSAKDASLSPQAQFGKKIFFDATLSASGKLSCATCHSPSHAYGPPNGLAVQLGGTEMKSPGTRAVPSLEYILNRTPIWYQEHPVSRLEQLEEKDNAPRGGFTWDGRFNSLHDQASFPLLEESEMANGNAENFAKKLRQTAYKNEIERICGANVWSDTDRVFACARYALERFELEDPSFHPYSSKYDAYLDGKVQLSEQEQRGLKLFNDPDRGNCANCHIAERGADGSHPLFTDYQYEAIGVPRNAEIPADRDAAYYDLGLCGPIRKDQMQNASYCGLFKTPTLRNVATRSVFFHNGRFHTLKEALRWYVERDIHPELWYRHGKGGKIEMYDDIPAKYRGNVDRITPPFDRHEKAQPVWNDSEIDDVIAFLKTLNDGYQP